TAASKGKVDRPPNACVVPPPRRTRRGDQHATACWRSERTLCWAAMLLVNDGADEACTERYYGMARCVMRDSEPLVPEECRDSDARRLWNCRGNMLHDNR